MPGETRQGGSAGVPQPPPAVVEGQHRPRWKWTKRLALVALVVVVGGGALLAGAEYYTTQPTFCGSCHVMEPYFESWHADAHGGKLDVACVDCHYAPGERTKFISKLRGLSQVTSYVSGRYGTSRPRAHVDNSSCMTAKCHGDLKFMETELVLGTVTFKHSRHLDFDAQKKQAIEKDLQALAQTLRELLGPERFAKLEEIARLALPAPERMEGMAKLLREWGIKAEADQLSRFTELHHRQIRIDQLADLQCTNCHSYVSPLAQVGELSPSRRARSENGSRHFTVKTTSCYTCHFNNEAFNSGTGTCLLCHKLPTKEILVHNELGPAGTEPAATTQPVKLPIVMNHQAMLERKVDCVACHADVAREDSTVTRRDCEHCHDRPEYFEQWKEPFSLELVKHYHAVHVPEQRAKCLDCHSEIHHQLARGPAGDAPAFLASAISNCSQCHPNHHAEQIQLLSGAGGVGIPKGEPNLMFGSRTNCFGCHTDHTKTKEGAVTATATVSGCIACHGDKHARTFDKWKQGLELALLDAEEAYQKAEAALAQAKDADAEVRRKAVALFEGAAADLGLVKRGNGVHNLMYSLDLLESVTRRCRQAASLLAKKPAPKKEK